ncbi:beta-hydroxyacyl-ACP dehydratase [Solihabitans fulvus]|uniref:Beta-hydroxyacyl-ACP dehydratase n=1 Tax=Solihabitans fulvus TaxID=1892852 RepID=A0A5B2WWX0_9PSEU|nr:beta-hydroxyacyl-ACP dehydratase [Solihabitans fulvus]KAA2254447.1 beta-hydroxyacyl-ACP dehydratase [Solihabitans fulvus]
MLEHADIKRILPHRHPILQVDRVLELDPGNRIVATKAVTGAEPCYVGLPAEAPASAYAYPVSLLVESLGQAGGILWLHTAAQRAEPVTGTLIFGSARDLTLTGHAYPGDVLRHVVHLELVKGDNAFMRGETWVGDTRIATVGEILAVLRQDTTLVPA